MDAVNSRGIHTYEHTQLSSRTHTHAVHPKCNLAGEVASKSEKAAA